MSHHFPDSDDHYQKDEQLIAPSHYQTPNATPKLPYEYKGKLPSSLQGKHPEYKSIPTPNILSRASVTFENLIQATIRGKQLSPLEQVHELNYAKAIGQSRSIHSKKDEQHQFTLTERCLNITENALPDDLENLYLEETAFELFRTYTQLLVEQTKELKNIDPSTILQTTKRMISAAFMYHNPDTWEEVFSLTKQAHSIIINDFLNNKESLFSAEDIKELEIIYGYIHLILGNKYIQSTKTETVETGTIFESIGVQILEEQLLPKEENVWTQKTTDEVHRDRELHATLFEILNNYQQWERSFIHLKHAVLGEVDGITEGIETLIDAGIPTNIVLPELEHFLFNYPENLKIKLLFAKASLSSPEYLREHPLRTKIMGEILSYIHMLTQLPAASQLSPKEVSQRNTFAKFLYTERRTTTAINILEPTISLPTLEHPQLPEEEKLTSLTVLALSHLQNKEFNKARNYLLSAQSYTEETGWYTQKIRECGAEKYMYALKEITFILDALKTDPENTSHQQELLHAVSKYYPLTREEALYTPVLPPRIKAAYEQLQQIFLQRDEPHIAASITEALTNYAKFTDPHPERKRLRLLIDDIQPKLPQTLSQIRSTQPQND